MLAFLRNRAAVINDLTSIRRKNMSSHESGEVLFVNTQHMSPEMRTLLASMKYEIRKDDSTQVSTEPIAISTKSNEQIRQNETIIKTEADEVEEEEEEKLDEELEMTKTKGVQESKCVKWARMAHKRVVLANRVVQEFQRSCSERDELNSLQRQSTLKTAVVSDDEGIEADLLPHQMQTVEPRQPHPPPPRSRWVQQAPLQPRRPSAHRPSKTHPSLPTPVSEVATKLLTGRKSVDHSAMQLLVSNRTSSANNWNVVKARSNSAALPSANQEEKGAALTRYRQRRYTIATTAPKPLHRIPQRPSLNLLDHSNSCSNIVLNPSFVPSPPKFDTTKPLTSPRSTATIASKNGRDAFEIGLATQLCRSKSTNNRTKPGVQNDIDVRSPTTSRGSGMLLSDLHTELGLSASGRDAHSFPVTATPRRVGSVGLPDRRHLSESEIDELNTEYRSEFIARFRPGWLDKRLPCIT